MVRGYYIKVYMYKFQNYIIINVMKMTIKMFEVNIITRIQLEIIKIY